MSDDLIERLEKAIAPSLALCLEAAARIRQLKQGVEVKPLEWLGGGGRYHAGDYVIEDISYGQREVKRLLRASFGTTYLADFAGHKPLEAAKAAAQADYEARIRSALTPAPVTDEALQRAYALGVYDQQQSKEPLDPRKTYPLSDALAGQGGEA